MNERVLKCLYDIKIAAEEIDSFFETESRDFENYKGNSLLKRAIERNLEIIGEAMNRILTEDRSGFADKIKARQGLFLV